MSSSSKITMNWDRFIFICSANTPCKKYPKKNKNRPKLKKAPNTVDSYINSLINKKWHKSPRD